ncbi:helix-turn-helix transcriptional regulator [Spongiactinospora sp. TRM90649]|uniref:helix-turn-helix transcriptional regulator n=1 Tax=Spongiactinospora sp. TRM90649 TaxID=3031114 RepID=UPI0023F72B87|nr:helix-turn-helix transcriptional regulator [Spongiactinospora sp. TRM90649]MDF5759168.1 helix-turn-helix transcriptional regulator [Spongiactinospora sp. TRM90649]
MDGGAGIPRGRPELARARKRLGMNQDDAAEALLVATTTVSRWERGRQDIRPVYRARIAAVFGVTGEEVERWVEGGEPVETEVFPLTDFSDMSMESTVKVAEKIWRAEVDLERRHLLAALPFVPAAVDGWLSAWSYGPSGSAASQAAGRAVGMPDVDRLHQMWRTLSRLDHQYGSAIARPAVVDYLNTTVAPMLRGTYNERVGAALLPAAAEIVSLVGWTAFDQGNHGQAQHYYGQALKLAKVADNPLFGAHVLTNMSLQAIYTGEHKQAALLARAAVDSARRGEAPPRFMALLLVREAWTRALITRPGQTGDGHSAKEVEKLIGEGERAFAQGASDRDPYWSVRYDEHELGAETAVSWRLLGQADRAVENAESAARRFTLPRPRSAQLTWISAAHAYLGKRELEQALDTARRSLSDTGLAPSPRVVERLKQFDKRLKPYEKTIKVAEFRAHVAQRLAV